MSDASELGVLYTEHSALTAMTPVSSLWSYETCARGRNRPTMALNPDGSHEYWLARSDPLLNTILPGTGVSLIVNSGDKWTAGRSLANSRLLPRVSVVGPFTQARILHVGRSVGAVGAVLPPTLTPDVFNVPASELVDQIVPLQDLWARDDAERLLAALSRLGIRGCLPVLKDELVTRISRPSRREMVGRMVKLVKVYGGRVSIDRMARSQGLGRQQFAQRFRAAAGLPPKLFARITRFQALVRVLLSTNVSRWAAVAPSVGFYDQAHMINEFRAFTGSPPTVFFRPHGVETDPATIQVRGRPCEWLRRPELPADEAFVSVA